MSDSGKAKIPSREQLISRLAKFEAVGEFEKAIKFLKEASDLGNPDGLALIGSMYLNMDIYNHALAKSWSHVAATSGSPLGMYNYAVILINEDDPDTSEAILWFEKAAEMGEVEAFFQLGEIYESDSLDKSITAYKSALSLGIPEVSYKLGTLYSRKGEGILAEVWFIKAAEMGSLEAMKKLAFDCESSGDLKGARKWHEMLVELESTQHASLQNFEADFESKKPELRLIRNPREAEEVATEWMQFFGFKDARTTPIGPDSGIDIESQGAVAQVKMEGITTSRPTVQALAGVAATEAKKAIFFSLGGYTAEAITWSEKAGVALFQFDLQGVPTPVNIHAHRIFRER